MIAVRTPQAHEYETVFRLLYHRLDPEEQQARVDEGLVAISRGELSPQGLLLAEAGGRPVGALLSAVQPDNTVFVWPPVTCETSGEEAVAGALLAELTSRMDAAGAWLGQSLLDMDDAAGRDVMARHGFPRLTDLCYLEKLLQTPLARDAAPLSRREIPFETVAYDPPRNRERFARVLEETYRGTLDCPELNGLRTAGDALDGHRCSGEFDPARWKIYCVEGNDVGVLLLNDHPSQNAYEIVYLGIAESYRGRGYGRSMILRGCRDVQRAGRASVLVAVDCRNSYAKKIYSEAGFAEIATKAVHVRVGKPRGLPR